VFVASFCEIVSRRRGCEWGDGGGVVGL